MCGGGYGEVPSLCYHKGSVNTCFGEGGEAGTRLEKDGALSKLLISTLVFNHTRIVSRRLKNNIKCQMWWHEPVL